jgi:hypothetical protein
MEVKPEIVYTKHIYRIVADRHYWDTMSTTEVLIFNSLVNNLSNLNIQVGDKLVYISGDTIEAVEKYPESYGKRSKAPAIGIVKKV